MQHWDRGWKPLGFELPRSLEIAVFIYQNYSIMSAKLISSICRPRETLTHFIPMVSFYEPWQHQKTRGNLGPLSIIQVILVLLHISFLLLLSLLLSNVRKPIISCRAQLTKIWQNRLNVLKTNKDCNFTPSLKPPTILNIFNRFLQYFQKKLLLVSTITQRLPGHNIHLSMVISVWN